MAAPRAPAPAPPKGYRRKIPDRVKLAVALKQLGITVTEIQWDHDPPLQLRVWDGTDTVPPANDPNHIRILLISDHRKKTSGGPAKATGRGSDQTEIARTRRLSKRQEEFRSTLLAKEPGVRTAPKKSWPKRPLGKGKGP